ncbi:MAG TPA: GntR family transcriptional regulator [Roseiarcus sp.]|nr:GntR family transcriptional regulator [Roseiarcus sp.]
MTLIVKTVLADQIFEIVRARIISGALAGEAPIRQDALAAELGVSKIPLREAFVRLEQDGLVVSKANRGFFVSPLSAAEAYDVFDLRLKLEPAAVAEGATRAGEADRDAARRALAALDRATEARVASVASLNRAFHMALARPAGRRVTLMILERLQVVAERYVVRHLEPSGRSARAIGEHQALYAAWAAGRAEQAARLSAMHIESTLRDLRTELEGAQFSSPAKAGKGDHAKHGGGGRGLSG